MGHARKMLKNTLDADTFKRVTFLMDKENIPQD
jgi:hypothetical protein